MSGFKAGDLVENIAHPAEIARGCHVRPGARGVIVDFSHTEVSITLGGVWRALWWRCDFGGTLVIAEEGILRKLPPDPGRQVVDWDWRTLKAPREVA